MRAWPWDANQANCQVGPLLITYYLGAPTPYDAPVRALLAELPRPITDGLAIPVGR
jgi:hypothetical protein